MKEDLITAETLAADGWGQMIIEPETYGSCPYCGHKNKVRSYDDWEGCELEGNTDVTCGKCEKTYIVSRAVIFVYGVVGKADCLNDSGAAWDRHVWHDHKDGRKSCTVCGEIRGNFSRAFLQLNGLEPSEKMPPDVLTRRNWKLIQELKKREAK